MRSGTHGLWRFSPLAGLSRRVRGAQRRARKAQAQVPHAAGWPREEPGKKRRADNVEVSASAAPQMQAFRDRKTRRRARLSRCRRTVCQSAWPVSHLTPTARVVSLHADSRGAPPSLCLEVDTGADSAGPAWGCFSASRTRRPLPLARRCHYLLPVGFLLWSRTGRRRRATVDRDADADAEARDAAL
ncbi:hypothetical protein DFH11DRAFT_313331 [Phellopilus nigrolimitatus]|nr:hypothetical protein DFH11DRAFT_313331 [Phellopilus nigrolimitatus]